jgi:hypothetical protein
MSRSVRESHSWPRSQCHVGDKEPLVCQSDDQFTVFNYALDHCMDVVLSTAHYPPVTLITVVKLNVHGAPPFDYDLHRIAESLRSDSDFIRLHSCGTFHRTSERCP